MNWNVHSNLIGNHAFLGASKYHWINYDEQKLADSYNNFLAAQKGTELHEFAATCIKLGQKLLIEQQRLRIAGDKLGQPGKDRFDFFLFIRF